MRHPSGAEHIPVGAFDGEKANGELLKVKAFGDSNAYALWALAKTLPEDLNITILHAGQGTLWTDLQKATLGELGGAHLLQKQGRQGREEPMPTRQKTEK